jgi:hypothetical protein
MIVIDDDTGLSAREGPSPPKGVVTTQTEDDYYIPDEEEISNVDVELC